MMLQMLAGCCLLLGVLQVAPAHSQTPQSAPPPSQRQPTAKPSQGKGGAPQSLTREAEAYFQFLLGRHLESEGNAAGAMKAFSEAARLDPTSAEIRVEIASLHARENRLVEATAMAEAALKLDPRNAGANRLLGFIHADAAQVEESMAAFGAGAGASAARAAGYLENARRNLEMPDPAVDMVLGRIYIRSGASDKAIPVLSQLVVDQPGQPEPVNLLLQAYLQAGRTAEAAGLLEAVAGLQPQFLPMLAELYERQRRWADAARAYERAVERMPRNLELRTRLAAVLLSDGGDAQVGRALDLLQQIRRESPADRRVLYLLAQAQREAGKLDDAEATARQLLAVAPGWPTGAYVLGVVLGQKQQYRGVVETLEPVVGASAPAPASDTGGDLLPALLQLGFAYLELGDADRARSTFERAQKMSPGNPTVELYLIEAQLAAKRYAEAVALARKARSGQPGSQRLLRLEAEALRQDGKGDEGAALLADALATRPDEVASYTALAEFEAARARYDAALAVLARAAEKFPGDLTVSFVAGSVYERQKRFADAERKFRDVLAKDPLHAPTLNYLGYMLADRGERFDEAVGYIKRALAADPHNAAYLDSLGWAYFRQSKLDLAEENLSKAAAQRGRDSAIQDHYGDLLFKLNRYQDAASAWQRALDGDGEQIDRGAIDKKLRLAREKLRKH
jgi:tetratricopeptide (TPR) repeat protein